MSLFRAVLIAAIAVATPAHGEDIPPAKAFGARESIAGASLSPDGRQFAFLAPSAGQGSVLFVVPVDGSAAPKRVITASGKPERLLRCDWVSDQRLVCTVGSVQADVGRAGEITGTTRLLAVNRDGSDVKLVSRRDAPNALYYAHFGGEVIDWLPGQDGAILIGNWYVPEARIGSLIERRREGYGVDRVDTSTLSVKRVVEPHRDANEYISDGEGTVRIMGVAEYQAEYFTTGTIRYLYRAKGRDDWQPLGVYNRLTREGFNPYAVDSRENVVYGLKRKDGRQALYKRRLDGSNYETLVFARPDVDVDGLIRIGRKQRIIGVTFATERRQAHYFDPEYEKLRASLARTLPGNPLVSFEGASADEKTLLLWAGSDVDPGRYFVLDRATKQMRPLLLSRPELRDYKLATVRAVSVAAADGAAIPAYLTLPSGSDGKGLPAIVMPHGGPSARDEWGFDWLAQYYANRGYAVLQPNFRGSSGYGDEWYRNNGFRSWRIAIGDVTDSGRWLVTQGIADPAKLAIVGWSYGGYAALQSAAIAPDLFKAVVAIAPVTDLEDLKAQYRNQSNRAEVRDFIGTGPHVREGSPTTNARAIKAPVLLFHGALDQNVRLNASRLMADKLRDAGKRHELVVYQHLDHGLVDAKARAELLDKSDAFLRDAMAMR